MRFFPPSVMESGSSNLEQWYLKKTIEAGPYSLLGFSDALQPCDLVLQNTVGGTRVVLGKFLADAGQRELALTLLEKIDEQGLLALSGFERGLWKKLYEAALGAERAAAGE